MDTAQMEYYNSKSQSGSINSHHASPLEVGDAPLRSGAHTLDILVKCPPGGFERWRGPSYATLHPFCIANANCIHRALFRINLDDVSILNERDGAAHLSFGRHVSNDKSVRAAAKSTVGEQSAVVTQTSTLVV